MNNLEDQIIQFALRIHQAALSISVSNTGLFKGLYSFHFNGRKIPLLLVGNADAKFEDGHCIAILNPSSSVMPQISPGVAYGSDIKKIVSGNCELMLNMFFEHYKEEKTIVNDRYASKAERDIEVVIK
jgi:hypothetical protein